MVHLLSSARFHKRHGFVGEAEPSQTELSDGNTRQTELHSFVMRATHTNTQRQTINHNDDVKRLFSFPNNPIGRNEEHESMTQELQYILFRICIRLLKPAAITDAHMNDMRPRETRQTQKVVLARDRRTSGTRSS